MAKSKRDADVQDARDNGADGSIRAIDAKAKSRATARKRHDSTAERQQIFTAFCDFLARAQGFGAIGEEAGEVGAEPGVGWRNGGM